METHSAFYRELEKRGWIGPAITAGLGAWQTSSTAKENRKTVQLDTKSSMKSKYQLAPPSHYKYGQTPSRFA